MRIGIFSFLFIFTFSFFCFFNSAVAEAQAYCVKAPLTKLHVLPDEKSKILARPAVYTPLSGTGNKKEHWVEVTDVNSVKYWVQRKMLTTNMSCLVVVVNHTKLRSGPGADYSAAKNKVADKNSVFQDLGGEDGWTQVKDETGTKSWVNIDHVWKPKNKMRISFDGN